MNAELQRLLWLDFTGSRVTALGIALGAIVGLGWLIDGRQLGGTTAAFTLAACSRLPGARTRSAIHSSTNCARGPGTSSACRRCRRGR